eukprot:1160678-Pelagomonas_calceolata.AAC.5
MSALSYYFLPLVCMLHAEIAEVNRQEAILRAQAAELARARRAERFEAAVQEAERKRQAALDTCNSVEERAVRELASMQAVSFVFAFDVGGKKTATGSIRTCKE